MSQNVNPQAQIHASAETTKIMAGSSVLDQLKSMSVVVADTGDFGSIQTFKPEDATTNPTLLFQAVQIASYKHLLDDAIAYARAQSSDCKSKCGKAECDRVVEMVCDRLAVNFGVEILKVVPGVVSTEVDAKLSFNAAAMIEKARKLISMYADVGVSKDRILIKLATTWEGCKAAEVLEREGIRCNMTLLFSMAQARAAAEAGATLISPFVGRILDWHKKNDATLNIQNGSEDPGVQSVRGIYQYYKAHGYKTVVMGASFRNSGEIIALAGCDKLTVSPALLNEMSTMTGTVERVLSAEKVTTATEKVQPLTEAQFRWMFNEDAMATEKLAEGIRNFNKDLDKLVAYVKAKMDL